MPFVCATDMGRKAHPNGNSSDAKLWLNSLNAIHDVQKGLFKRTIQYVHRIEIQVDEVDNVEEA